MKILNDMKFITQSGSMMMTQSVGLATGIT